MPSRSPSGPDPQAPAGQVQIIMDHDHVPRLDVMRRDEFLHGLTGHIHKRHRQCQHNGVTVESTDTPLREAVEM